MGANRVTIMMAAALTIAGCSSPISISNDTNQSQAPAPPPAPTTRPSNDKLVNAFDYYAKTDDRAGYFFVSPSGSWRCVIVPRSWAGCQSASGSLGIQGAPQTITDDTGTGVTPNAIVVRTEGDPQFAAVSADQFKPPAGTAKTLPFGKILAAAGFHCNVQQATGIACLSEETDKGFTFSPTGASWQYTDVP
ncbi:hypothetical protein MANY_17390 [Mycolicibacterium anyangense]|uniref:Lipoprotein n=1 Tax=Mycolicibacterium anyangense TaxID=1431246 RepID=A0A6N4W8K7_9MYCO|nr:hypothetical protein [Mycolicibacterium anyangense]BBZ76402.1 hypothetical protein MANY_17390 [Mycolicibacterium anyangense]